MGSFSFKSSGVTAAETAERALVSTALPIGIRTPISLGTDDLLTMSYDMATQLTDNLRNLILTNWGERVGLYEYGANLQPLTTDVSSLDDFDTQAIERIKTAVGRWMPYVDLQDFLSEADRHDARRTGVIKLTITFNIPSLNVRARKLEVFLYVI